MALTALDPLTGSVVFPFDNGCVKATCRDPHCHAALIAVKEYTFEDVTLRRPHWRHKIRAKHSTRQRSSAKETMWHMNWKMRCEDADRVEFRYQVKSGDRRGTVRIADVWTKFKWALEFQHSAIPTKEMTTRERHYKGRVVWIVDCASIGHTNGALDIDGPYLRWHAAPEWIRSTRALVAVDDGQQIHLLPPNFSSQLTLGNERILRDSIVTYEYPAWVAHWINGDEHPLGNDFASTWTLDRRDRAKDRELIRREESMIEQSYRRAQYGSDSCSFSGDRSKLIFIQGKIFDIQICRTTGCNSAASFDGTCHAHSLTQETR